MPDRVVRCHACGAEHRFDSQVPRRATCDSCAAELHCCNNCRFYEPSSYNECREPVAERVVDKRASNFCDLFEPGATASAGDAAGASGAKAELEKLFGKS